MTPYQKHFNYAQNHFNPKKLKHYIENIYASDHYPDFKGFHKTAHWVADELAKYNIKTRVIEFPADGKTTYGDWIMPKAWDAISAKLIEPKTNETVADYSKIPANLVMGSSSTPKGGITKELIYASSPEEFSKINVKDKLVLTKFMPNAYKKSLIERGGCGFIFHGTLRHDQYESVRWVNSWSDEPDQWQFTEKDTPCPGISLSPKQVDQFIKRFEEGEKIILNLEINTKTYDGTLPVVEAFIQGQTDQEIFMTGHLYEQGANDNCSGCASMMEIARMFSKNKPKRGIRILFTSEIYGTIPYCYENLETLQNCIAGINIDSTAEVSYGSNKMQLYQNPLTNPSFVNILFDEITFASGEAKIFTQKNFVLDDNLVTDPQINIPCLFVGGCSQTWHTHIDTMDIIDWELFNLTTICCAAWVSFAVNGEEKEALALNKSLDFYLSNWNDSTHQNKNPKCQPFIDDFTNEVKHNYQASINNLHPIHESSYKKPSENGPTRKYFGVPSFSQIPIEKRKENNIGMWSGNCYLPLFLADGTRSIDRIAAYMELGFDYDYDTTHTYLNKLYEFNYLESPI
ncbi:MAG: hypothetical protein COA79_08300 [Planctomycetota bacterium]|nr:MAG: hypothetical protein COA79_08300 [Planctomycetota bacterium]